MKRDIADYRSDRLKRVEEYIIDLTKKADTLENIQLEIRQFLKDSHTATIITEKECKSGELLKAHGLNTTAKFDYDEQTLIKNGGEEHITKLLTFFRRMPCCKNVNPVVSPTVSYVKRYMMDKHTYVSPAPAF